jgi:recombinational DNA repair protein RecR
MQAKNFEKRVYTPQLSAQASATIRRFAWSMGKPMTKAIENLILALPAIVNPAKICLSCQDRSDCKACIFCRQITAEDKTAILAAL